MKRALCLVLAMAIFVASFFSFNIIAFADTEQLEDSSTYYSYDYSTATLTISGTGATPNYTNSSASVPWYNYRDSIKKVVIGEGVTVLGSYLLYQVKATEIILPSTLETISNYALSYTTGVTSWSLPYGVKNISNYAFYACSTMESITLPRSVTYIGMRAFNTCQSLTEITIPYAVTNIGSYAFYGCSSLNSVTFESMSSQLNIGSNVFTQCASLKEIYVPQNASLGTHFYGYSSNTSKYSGIRMYVYYNSPAMLYAQSSSIPYSLIDTTNIECGVRYYNKFAEDGLDAVHHYRFVPDSSADYNFYTNGDNDARAQLFSSSNLIAESDDIDDTNRNFAIKASLTAGEPYDLFVSTLMVAGEYNLVVYPSDVLSVDIAGTVSMNASDKVIEINRPAHYDVDFSMLKGFVLDIKFANGFEDKTSIYDKYFVGDYIRVIDNDSASYTCGDNVGLLYVAGHTATYNVHIDHSFDKTHIEATPDEDGYSLYTCVGCGYQYADDFAPTDKRVYTITGRCVLAEDRWGNHESNMPYSFADVYVDNRQYSVSSDGSWSVRTFGSCSIAFDDYYGDDKSIYVTIDEKSEDVVDGGTIALCGYDINADGIVNAIDYVLYRNMYGRDNIREYWQFIGEFLINY